MFVLFGGIVILVFTLIIRYIVNEGKSTLNKKLIMGKKGTVYFWAIVAGIFIGGIVVCVIWTILRSLMKEKNQVQVDFLNV